MKTLRLFFFISVAFLSNVAAQTVYITKTGEKFHKSNCRYLKYSKKEITLKKALNYGYEACKVCKPNTKKVTVNNNSSTSVNPKTTTSSKKKSTAIQCTGITKAGNRCKRRTKNASGRCYQH